MLTEEDDEKFKETKAFLEDSADCKKTAEEISAGISVSRSSNLEKTTHIESD